MNTKDNQENLEQVRQESLGVSSDGRNGNSHPDHDGPDGGDNDASFLRELFELYDRVRWRFAWG